jgi:hypothetical protein
MKAFGTNLGDLLLFVEKLDDGIRAPHILDGEAGVPRWSLALDERRNLDIFINYKSKSWTLTQHINHCKDLIWNQYRITVIFFCQKSRTKNIIYR